MTETIVGISILMAALAGIITSGILLWTKLIRPMFRFFTRVGKVVDVVQELPEWCVSVDGLLEELRPSSGGSIKDKIDNMNSLLEHHMNDHEIHGRR